MPGPRGRAPTKKAKSMSLKATSASSEISTLCNNGNAQSFNSMTVPSKAPNAGVISNKCKQMGCSGPKKSPDAIRNNNEYEIWPAAPVTAT